MSDSNIKDIRKQLRNVAKESMDQEFGQALYNKVMLEVQKKLIEIQKDIQLRLQAMDDRHKDTMQYLIRQVSVPVKAEDKKGE